MSPRFHAISKDFPYLLGLSLIGCLLGTWLSAPTEMKTLKRFYRNVRPWGSWGPVRKLAEDEDPGFQRNRDFKRNAINVGVGTVWQTGLVIPPFYLVLMRWKYFGALIAINAPTSLFLKKNWHDKLHSGKGGAYEPQTAENLN